MIETEAQKVEILSIPEELRESISDLSNRLAISQSRIIELEKKNEALNQKLFTTVTLLESAREQIWEMYKILDKKG